MNHDNPSLFTCSQSSKALTTGACYVSHTGLEESNSYEVDEYIESLPCGYRFLPTDEELITCFLRGKNLNQPLPVNRFKSKDFYEYNPQQLSENHKLLREREWYFFTRRQKKYSNGSRPNRTAGDGFWKATGSNSPVTNDGGVVIGYKRTLVYYTKVENEKVKSDWIMQEYMLKREKDASANPSRSTPCTGASRPLSDMMLDEWVLCKLYKNDRSKNKSEENIEGTPMQEVPNTNENQQEVHPARMEVSNTEQNQQHQNFIPSHPVENYTVNVIRAGYGEPNYSYGQGVNMDNVAAVPNVLNATNPGNPQPLLNSMAGYDMTNGVTSEDLPKEYNQGFPLINNTAEMQDEDATGWIPDAFKVEDGYPYPSLEQIMAEDYELDEAE